jgi:hypothetical protein
MISGHKERAVSAWAQSGADTIRTFFKCSLSICRRRDPGSVGLLHEIFARKLTYFPYPNKAAAFHSNGAMYALEGISS